MVAVQNVLTNIFHRNNEGDSWGNTNGNNAVRQSATDLANNSKGLFGAYKDGVGGGGLGYTKAAAKGAALGSVGGPIGTVIGAIGGLITHRISNGIERQNASTVETTEPTNPINTVELTSSANTPQEQIKLTSKQETFLNASPQMQKAMAAIGYVNSSDMNNIMSWNNQNLKFDSNDNLSYIGGNNPTINSLYINPINEYTRNATTTVGQAANNIASGNSSVINLPSGGNTTFTQLVNFVPKSYI